MAVDPDALATRVVARERAAVAQALSLVEDRRPSERAAQRLLLARLARAVPAGAGHRVGITGPPGAGKSTLVGALARVLRGRGQTVGVVAVDPSSVRSGGALLGDRARMAIDPADDGLFVRSLATEGQRGGLGLFTHAAVRVLAAAYEVVIVETTGVGQSETDIEGAVDTVVVVVQPGAGDSLQFVKAGVMEIADLFVVTKADQGKLADRAMADLKGAIQNAVAAGAGSEIAVLSVSARDGTGLSELADALDRARDELGSRGLEARRARGEVVWALDLLQRRFGVEGLAAVGGLASVRARLAAAVDSGHSPLAVADEVGAELLEKLRQG